MFNYFFYIYGFEILFFILLVLCLIINYFMVNIFLEFKSVIDIFKSCIKYFYFLKVYCLVC